MASQSTPNPESRQGLLKIIKALTSMPAQMLFYGSALLAIVATGGVALPGILGTLATTVGMNVLSNMLERVARGDDIPDEEIRKAVEDVIRNSGIEKLTTSSEFQHAIAHVFRQFDLLTYAVQKGEFTIAAMLTEQYTKHKVILDELQSEISVVRAQLENLATREQGAEILKNVQLIAEQGLSSKLHFPIWLVDQKIEDEVEILRRSRFFVEFDRVRSSLALARKLVNGEFASGTDAVRSRALAWIARVLSSTEEKDIAEEYLRIAKDLGTCPEIEIAQAFIYSQKGDKSTALSVLARIDKPSSRSAALMIVAHHEGPEGAAHWLKTAGINDTDLDSDGRFFLLMQQLQLARWEAAQECISVVTDEDLIETPVLNHMVAITHLISTVPNELRAIVINQLPFEAASFPLASDMDAVETRREAHRHFINAAKVAKQLCCPLAAIIDDEYALWLELKDPDESEKGKQRLQDKLRDPESALRLVHLGLQFGINLDLEAVEREIERQVALHGEITQNAAIARFALAFTQKSPEDVANYVARYREELSKYFDKKSMMFLEIEMLARAGLLDRAKGCLNILKEEGLSEGEENRLRRIIAEAEGADPIESRKEQFKTTGSLGDLATLVDELETKGDWDSLCEYGQILFERTHSLHDAVRFATALSNTQKTERLVEFLKANSDLLTQSKNLQMQYSWALYYEGALLEARSELEKLSDDWGNANYRILQINLGISLGDWNSLSTFVANEYLEKDKRSAQDLISAAQLALHIGSPHAKELIYASADKSKNDAGVLAAAYFLASKAGWEDDAEVYKWLHEAATLSGDDGPIKKMTLRDVLNQKPEWDRRESETWQQLSRGELPMFLAAQSLNKSLIDLMLVPALINLSEKDPRRRGAVPSYSGKRQPIQLETRGVVGIDATALLTLSFLNLLDKAFDAFDMVHLPHSTLAWLFEEKQKATFHQPSRIRDAHQIRNLLATEKLEKLYPSTVPDSDLSAQVGDELALLIAEAEKVRDNNDIQRIVVRSSPVHRITSLMAEEADLVPHAAVLSSCQAIVEKLRQKGQITAEEEKKALAYLRLQEKPWHHQPEIADTAILYFDDLSITYFLHIGMLDKLRTAGFRTITLPNVVIEANELISYEGISGKVSDSIERIRSDVNSRIESGRIKVGRQPNIDYSKGQSISGHPTVGIFTLAKDCRAIIVDDRFLNQHDYFEDSSTQVPIFSTLDVIDTLTSTGSITPEERLEYRTRLRRASYFFVPIIEDELAGYLNASQIKENKVIETAELKAVRENILRVRMSTWLQLPKEANWINMTLEAFIRVLKSLWRSSSDLTSVHARSDWILNQVDVRGWAHCLDSENGDNIVKIGRGAHILMVLTPPVNVPQNIKNEYWSWVEDRVLAPIKEQYPDLYSWIVDWHRRQIAETAKMDLTEWGAT